VRVLGAIRVGRFRATLEFNPGSGFLPVTPILDGLRVMALLKMFKAPTTSAFFGCNLVYVVWLK